MPAQIMHAAAPLRLHDAFFLTNMLQALTFASDALWVDIGVIAGVQPIS